MEKFKSFVKWLLKRGNSLDTIRVGFEPKVGYPANYEEGTKVVYNGSQYQVVNNRWVAL